MQLKEVFEDKNELSTALVSDFENVVKALKAAEVNIVRVTGKGTGTVVIPKDDMKKANKVLKDLEQKNKFTLD